MRRVPIAAGSNMSWSPLGASRDRDFGTTFLAQAPGVQHLSISDYHQKCVNTPGGPIGNELEIRSLRYFVAAAEELNFTRAAARLYIAQQALSREIKRLEERLGTTLFLRTTRRVTLTPDGERLLVRARDLVARHDAVWADVHVPAAQPTVVDLMSEGRLTATRILDGRASRAPTVDFRGRYTRRDRGCARTTRDRWPRCRLRTGRLARGPPDADHRSCPRSARAAGAAPARRASAGAAGGGSGSQPAGARDRRAADALGCARMDRPDPSSSSPCPERTRRRRICRRSGSRSRAITWSDRASRSWRRPTMSRCLAASFDPCVDPIPLYAWSMAWRRGSASDGISALRDAAVELGAAEDWLREARDPGHATWLPEPDASRLANGTFRLSGRD